MMQTFYASDGVRLAYYVDDHTDPWREPQTILMLHSAMSSARRFYSMVPGLAAHYRVVRLDSRGHGASQVPPPDVPHSKERLSKDVLELLDTLGLEKVHIIGGSAGGYTGQLLAIDHPQAVVKVAVLDIAPTLAIYEQTNEAFARAYWHWFFLILPAPVPERMIGNDLEGVLPAKMGMGSAGMSPFAPAAWAQYVRCFTPGMVHASCEDYRAAASIDLVHDRADREAGRKVKAPLLVLWGARGVVEKCFKPLDEWRRVADDVRGHALPAGHYLPEEVPDLVADELEEFFR